MRTLAVLPVKRFGHAKARLAARLEPPARATLAEAMLGDVLAALGQVSELDGVAVVTANERAAEIAARAGAVVLHDSAEAGQSEAGSIGIAHALADGCERVVLVPGDTPLLDPGALDELLLGAEARRLGVAIVPDRHGTGTNALALHPPTAIEPSFGPGSRERHEVAARAAGVASSVERVATLEHDVDTPDDLAALLDALDAGHPAAAPRTRAALGELAPAGSL